MSSMLEFLNFFIPTKFPKSFITEYRDKYYSACIFAPEKLVSKITAASQLLSSVFVFFVTIEFYNLLRSITDHAAVISLLMSLPLYLFSAYLISKLLLNAYLILNLSSKNERIGRELYHVVNIMYGLARAGHDIMKIIEKVIDSDVHSDIKAEFLKIRNRVMFFGDDLRSAILNVAFTTPSPEFAQFLKGLVAYMDKSKDLSGYLSEYLTVENINRRLYLQAFNERVNIVAGIYIYTMVILPIIAIAMAIMNVVYGTGDDTSVLAITYVIVPFMTLIASLMVLGTSPEKEMDRPLGNIAQALIVVVLLLAITPLYLFLIGLPDYRFYGLVVSLILASVASVVMAWQHHIENSIERETPSLLNYLLAASKANESLTSAIFSTSREKIGHVDKYIREVATLSSSAIPIEKALKSVAKKVPTIFAKLMFTILSETAKSTKKTLDVLTGLINEYHRYVEYRQHRNKITSSVTVTILFTFAIILASLYILEVKYLGAMVSLIGKEVLMSAGRVGVQDIERIHNLFQALTIMIGALMPVGLAAIHGDHRTYFRYYVLTGLAVVVYLVATKTSLVHLLSF